MPFNQIKFLILIVLLLLNSACSTGSTYCPWTCSLTTTDDDITESIQAHIMSDRALANQSIRVYTFERTVTLKGNVENKTQKCAAELIALNTYGVQRVVSKLTIKSYDNT